MKFVKVIVFLLIIIAIAMFGLNYISPNDIHVSESIEVDAEPSVVYQKINGLGKMSEWQPWLKKDPNAEVSITGTDGQVGAIRHWSSSVDEVGVGEQELTKLVANQRVESKLRFMKPFESQADSYIQLDPIGSDKTKVTWGMMTNVPFPANIMMKFQVKSLKKSFLMGLTDLKSMCVSANPLASNHISKNTQSDNAQSEFVFTEVNRNKTVYLIKRDSVKMKDIGNYFKNNMADLYNVVLASGGEIVGPPTGLYFDWNEETKVTVMAVALPIPTLDHIAIQK